MYNSTATTFLPGSEPNINTTTSVYETVTHLTNHYVPTEPDDFFGVESKLHKLKRGVEYTELTAYEYAHKWVSIISGRYFYDYKDWWLTTWTWYDFFFIPPGYDDMYSFRVAKYKYRRHPVRDLYTMDGGEDPRVRLAFGIMFYTRMALGGIGMIVNIINMVTFTRMGLKDSFVLVLFNIAFSDLCYNTFVIMYDYVFIVDHWKIKPVLIISDTVVTAIYLNAVIKSVVIVNGFLTTFLGVQRCLCVLLPLKFKGIFTWKRTAVIITVLWTFFIPNLLPPAIHIGLSWFDFVRVDSVAYQSLMNQMDFVNMIVLNFACQIVVLSSVFIMIWVLLKSFKFRQKASNSGNLSEHKPTDEEKTNTSKQLSSKSLTNSKEIKVIIQVTIISIIFIVTHIHFSVVSVMRLVIPYYLERPKYALFDILYTILKQWLYQFNATVNIFIYLKYNSKYRQYFLRRHDK